MQAPNVVCAVRISDSETTNRPQDGDDLANYEVPREIRILDALPRSSAGTILQAELHEFIADS